MLKDLKNSTVDNIKKLTPSGVTTYAMKRIQMKKKRSIELDLTNKNENAPHFWKRYYDVDGIRIPLPSNG